MKPRRILTVLDGEETDAGLLRQSVSICAAWDAKLDGLFVRRNAASGGDFLGDAFSTYGMEAVLEALDDAAAKASDAAHAAFTDVADDAPSGVIGRFIEYIGLPRAAMAREGRLSDLIIMEKPQERDLRNQLNAIETAAFESGRPVLVMPEECGDAGCFKDVVVAWDGSLEATRAVVGALPFLAAAETVLLLHAGADADSADQLADLAAYLDTHGIKSATRSVTLEGRSAARALIETSTANGADLLVMGGFGAPGWQRSLGRDETTALIKKVPFAILLAH
ncbi:MAG: universal stress protein [Alphaproteobacteria bacterium]|nr:universal stress protein [Alphaproteobacteria bacterium]